MATIKTTYVTYSCPKCQRELYKAVQGAYEIGTPIINCHHCQLHFRNPMQDEWFNYTKKVQAFLIPALLPVMMGGVMLLLTMLQDNGLEPALMMGFGAVLGLIIGVVMIIMNLVKVMKSKKRMKSRAYLGKLLSMNIISMEDFEALEKEANAE